MCMCVYMYEDKSIYIYIYIYIYVRVCVCYRKQWHVRVVDVVSLMVTDNKIIYIHTESYLAFTLQDKRYAEGR